MAVARRLIEMNGMFLLLERRGIVVYRRLVRTVGGEVPLRGGEICLRLVVTTPRLRDSAFFLFLFCFLSFILFPASAFLPNARAESPQLRFRCLDVVVSSPLTSDFNARNGIILLNNQCRSELNMGNFSVLFS